MAHPGNVPDHALVRTSAYTCFKVEYFGRQAHAAAAPWEGVSIALLFAYLEFTNDSRSTRLMLLSWPITAFPSYDNKPCLVILSKATLQTVVLRQTLSMSTHLVYLS